MTWATYKGKGSKSKYGASKASYNGIEFDSKKECRRYGELYVLERAGKIHDLKMQVKFVLIPTQREPDTIGARGAIKKGKIIERECAYIADFTYYDSEDNYHVEDVKGYKDGAAYNLFKIKRKLMLYVHGIRIEEI